MKAHEITFLRRLLAEQPAARRSQGVAGAVRKSLGLGAAGDDCGYIRYSDEDFARAREILIENGSSTSDGSGQLSTLEPRAATRFSSDKSWAPEGATSGAPGGQPGYVAAVPIDMDPQLPSTSFLTIPWTAAAQLPFESLLVCEKLASLGRLAQYSWLRKATQGRPTLAVYRGGDRTGVYGHGAARNLMEASSVPIVALHDFDPTGLLKACMTPRLESLSLPDLVVLEELARRRPLVPGFIGEFQKHRGKLDRANHPHISELWALMQRLRNGVEVEAFPE